MLRFLGVILLCVCVCAMPSYAAVTCGSGGCATSGDAHEHDCCPSIVSSPNAGDENAGGERAPTRSESGHRHHCAAPCCGFVAHVLSAPVARLDGRPLARSIPAPAAIRAAVDHDAPFHPPRL